jgi:hypothetical protein
MSSDSDPIDFFIDLFSGNRLIFNRNQQKTPEETKFFQQNACLDLSQESPKYTGDIPGIG